MHLKASENFAQKCIIFAQNLQIFCGGAELLLYTPPLFTLYCKLFDPLLSLGESEL